MKLSSAKAALQALDREFVDRISAILNGGATLGDQMSGEMISFRWNSAKKPAPCALRTLTKEPIGLFVLVAKPVADPSRRKGGTAIDWSWSSSKTGAAVTILDMALAASTDFDVIAWAIGG